MAGQPEPARPFAELSLSERQQLMRQRATERTAARKATKQAWEVAEEQARRYLTGSAYADALAAAPRIPAWVQEVHPSHRAWLVGGLVACSWCASASASIDKRTLLAVGCRGSWPTGSRHRIEALLCGQRPAYLARWPDEGRAPNDRATPLRLVRAGLLWHFARGSQSDEPVA